MELIATVYAPVLAPIANKDLASIRRRSDAAVDELVSLSGKLSAPSWIGPAVPIEIRLLNSPGQSIELTKAWGERESFRAQRFLSFATRQIIDLPEYRAQLEKQNPHCPADRLPDAELAAHDVVTSDLSVAVADIALAAAIATAGAFEIQERLGFCNSRYIRSASGCTSNSSWAAATASELGWPRLADPKVEHVWNWLRRLPGFGEGAPRGPAGRAVSALSQLFGEASAQTPVVGLVWALVGLEALFGNGTMGLKRQLMEKSEVLLGPRTAFKKRFDRIYDFRSRFVHGDIDFPLEYRSTEEIDEFERYADESVDAMLLAQAMLIAAVQRLVELDTYQVNFKYTLDLTSPTGADAPEA